jgi:chromosome segregation ATPase
MMLKMLRLYKKLVLFTALTCCALPALGMTVDYVKSTGKDQNIKRFFTIKQKEEELKSITQPAKIVGIFDYCFRLQNSLATIKNELAKYTQNHTHPNTEWEKLKKEQGELQTKVDLTSKESTKWKTSYDDTQKNLNLKNKDCTEHLTNLTNLQIKLQESEANLKKQNENYSRLEQTKNEIQEKFTKTTSDLTKYNGNYSHSNTDYDSLEADKTKVEQDYTTYKKNHTKTDTDYNTLKADKTKVEQDYTTYKKDYSHSNTDFETLTKRRTMALWIIGGGVLVSACLITAAILATHYIDKRSFAKAMCAFTE